jgi:ABC-type protease/lipase transport system fused ATPase/permease subunit
LYGDPQLIVLDEPNANLDQEGEEALAATLESLKRAGRTVVVVTHRKPILGLADKILMLVDGQIAAYGPRDKVLADLRQAAEQQAANASRRPVALALRPAGPVAVAKAGS